MLYIYIYMITYDNKVNNNLYQLAYTNEQMNKLL